MERIYVAGFGILVALAITALAVKSTSAGVPNQPYPEDGPFYSGEFAKGLPDPIQITPLRVVSYNVNFALKPDRIIRDLQTAVELKNADIILLQEVTGPIGGQENAPEIIARALHLNYVFSPGMIHGGVDYGNAILSRYPVNRFRKINLRASTLESINRTALVAELDLDGQPMEIVSIHLSTLFRDSYREERERAVQLSSALERLPDVNLPTLIGGDFNTFRPVSKIRVNQTFNLTGFRDAHPIGNWTMRYLRLQLDHLFSRGNIAQIQSGVSYDTNASDHLPIWSTITRPTR